MLDAKWADAVLFDNDVETLYGIHRDAVMMDI